MENKRKGNKVKKICDGITTRPHLKDYVMFEDNWISKHDKILYNEKNESFLVLDFKEYEENTLVMPDIMPHHNGWGVLEKHPDIINNNPLLQNIKYPSVTGNFTPVEIHENSSSDSLKQEELNV